MLSKLWLETHWSTHLESWAQWQPATVLLENLPPNLGPIVKHDQKVFHFPSQPHLGMTWLCMPQAGESTQ